MLIVLALEPKDPLPDEITVLNLIVHTDEEHTILKVEPTLIKVKTTDWLKNHRITEYDEIYYKEHGSLIGDTIFIIDGLVIQGLPVQKSSPANMQYIVLCTASSGESGL